MYRPPRVGLYWRAREDGPDDLDHRGGPRAAPLRPGHARARGDLRLAQRSPGAPSHGGLAGARPRRLREARELLRAPDPPVDPAIPRLRDGEDRGDGAIDRVDARARPARGRDDAGARR